MLTPPSAHRQVLLKHPTLAAHDSSGASERREAELAAKLEKERARALAARREHIALAQQERDSYLANVRSLFKMSPTVRPLGAQQRAPLAAKSAASSKLAAWSEVSTAAPSTAGAEDDDDDCTDPTLNSPEEVHRDPRNYQVEPPCLDLGDSLEGPAAMASACKALQYQLADRSKQAGSDVPKGGELDKVAGAPSRPPLQQRGKAAFTPTERIAPGSVAVGTASSSSTAQKSERRRAQSASPTPSISVERRDQSQSQRNDVQERRPKIESNRAIPSAQLKTISAEEEALERSLLLLDFGEMRRQFAGQEPLWKKEAFDASFDAHSALGATRHEEKLKASLQRLDGALGNLREDLALREEKQAARAEAARIEAEVASARCPSRERAPPSRGSGRPCSGVTTSGSRRTRASSAGSYGRRGLSEKAVRPVAKISAQHSARSAATPEHLSEGATAAQRRSAYQQHPAVRHKN